MKRIILILAALAAWTAAAATPNRAATEAYVTNKIAAAVAALPAPDYSTNNTELVETIQATAPAPGDYANVSDKAVNALSRAEAKSGFTEWEWTSTGPSITSVVWKASESEWVGIYSGGELYFEPPNNTNFNAIALHSNDVQARRTRLVPEKWALSNVTNATGGAVSAVDIGAATAAQGAKADAALSRAEAEAGFTEWKFSDGNAHTIDGPVEATHDGWIYGLDSAYSSSRYFSTKAEADAALDLEFAGVSVTATRTRLPTMADLNGKASTADVTLTPIYSQTPTFSAWSFNPATDGNGHPYSATENGDEYTLFANGEVVAETENYENAAEVAWVIDLSIITTATRTRTDIIGYTLGDQTDKPIASTNDLARASAIPSVVANIVRDLSLGGIWDPQLEVWWTPRMRNGSLTYEATTNVNLNAEN